PSPSSRLFPYTTLFRSRIGGGVGNVSHHHTQWPADLNSWDYPKGYESIPLDPMEISIAELRDKKNPIRAVINIGNTFQQHFAIRSEEHTSELQSRFDLV